MSSRTTCCRTSSRGTAGPSRRSSPSCSGHSGRTCSPRPSSTVRTRMPLRCIAAGRVSASATRSSSGCSSPSLVLGLTRSRSWAIGILIGQWAHVLTDMGDSAGVMPFFPFSTEPVTLGLWTHSCLGGPLRRRSGVLQRPRCAVGSRLDARDTALRQAGADRRVLPRGDRSRRPAGWAWLHRTFRLPEHALLMVYRGIFFYGLGRMLSWFLYARFDARVPFEPVWGRADVRRGYRPL